MNLSLPALSSPLVLSQWGGTLCLSLSFFCFWRASGAAEHVEAMEETPTSPAGSIEHPGYYEVKGRVICPDPLPILGRERGAIYLRERIWERTQEEFQDEEGLLRTRTVEKLVRDEVDLTEFTLEDESGSIRVDPRGADLDGATLVPRSPLEAADRDEGEDVEPERFRELVGILVGQDLYVLGPVQQRRGEEEPTFLVNRQEERPYLISVRSEEEQTAQHRLLANLYNLGGLLFGVLATGLLSFGLGYL